MGFHVHIKQGDLLQEEEADFIVNPSNTVLVLGSGVSGAFARACGPALQHEMRQALFKRGRLTKGDVVPTPPGGCPRFKTVLHTAVMDYNPGAPEPAPTLDDIKIILNNIYIILSDYSTKHPNRIRLVLPLMGTGVGGLNKRGVLLAYRDFFRRDVVYECDALLYAHTQDDYLLMTSVFAER